MPAVRRWSAAAAASALVLTASISAAGAAQAAVSAGAAVLVDEVYGGGGNSGAPYDRDFVELYNPGPASVDLTGWAVQYASATGATWQVTPLTGTVSPGGRLLVGEASGASAAPAISPDVSGTIAMASASGKVALTSSTAPLTCTGAACAALDAVVDLVGYGAATGYAGSGPAPAASNTTSVARKAGHQSTADNAADFVSGAPTPQGAATTPDPTPTPTGSPSPTPTGSADITSISAIQGTGDTSPLVGSTVTTDGVVTAVYPTGGLNGFVVQTAGTGGPLPAEHTASDAVFVYSPATVASVAVGQHLRLTGAVSEYNGLTELSVPSGGVERLADGATITPTTTAWPATAAAREALESMLVLPSGPFTVTNTYSTDQYGEVGLATGTTPLLQPTDVARPGSTQALAAAADDTARAVVLDDGSTTNYSSAANAALVPPYVSTTAPVRVGEAVTFTAPVVVAYRNAAWKLDPTTALVAGGTAPVTFADNRAAAPDAAALGSGLRVATFNVLNYFTTLGDATPGCVPYTTPAGEPVTVKSGCDPRGAWDPDDLARQQAKIVAAINGLDADVVGLLEIENSAKVDGVPDEALATLVGALNATAGAGTWAYVPSSSDLPPLAQQDVITSALIYRTAAVARSGPSHALGTASADGQAFADAREPIAQTFTPVGGGEPFLVVVNHFKSKGSAGPWPGDVDSGDGQGASNESRVREATALRDWVPTVAGDTRAVALLGDFNSYTHEDPLQVLYDAGYVDAASTLQPGEYSYSYSGLSGSLDHVLLNPAARQRATGADIWEINAEESVALEYSRYGYHGASFYTADPYRSSDHDPVVVGLDANTGPVDLTLLNLNDFHGRIDTNTVKVAGTVEQLRKAASDAGGEAVLLSAGDNIGASLFASASQKDQPTIDVLNALGLRASAVGNHELDGGLADLTDRVVAGGTNAQFGYLAANVYAKGTTDPVLPEYQELTMAGVRVAVVGAVTQETPALVSPGGIATVDFGDPVEAVNRVAARLTDGDPSNGEADVVVAEYHEGAGAGTPDGADLDQEVAAGGAFTAIVTKTSPVVSAIFTGHTHKQYAWQAPVPGDPTRTRPVLQTGSYGENVGSVVLTFDRASHKVTASAVTNVARTTVADATLVAAFPRVAQVKTIVDAALARAAELGNQPVGSVGADITTAYTGGSYVDGRYTGPGPLPTTGRDNRALESTLGSLVAQSLLQTLAAPERGGAEIAVVNPGGLRAELLHAPDGVVTYAEANAVLPFLNNLWTTTLTGAQVRTMLEQQWQTNPDGSVPSRPYLQLGLSSNVTYTYDASRPQGDRITSVTVGGAPLDPSRSYRIGTFSFLAQGGDNFRVLAQGTGTADSGLVDRDAWVAYLSAHPGLLPDFAERAVGVPAVTAPLTAGGSLDLPVTGLDLTSLGAPQNTSLRVLLDDADLGTVPVTSGAAEVAARVPSTTTAGTHVLRLVAAPSGTTVTVPVSVEVPLPASTTTLTASPAAQVYGAWAPRVLLSATVSSPAPAPLTGSVEFVAGGTVLGTAALVAGKATLRLPMDAAAGAYQVVARFSGPGVQASQSEPVTVTVVQASTRTSLVASVKVQRTGQWFPTFLVASVRQDNGHLPAGTVEFREADVVVARAPVVLGVAIGTVPRSAPPGSHVYTAVFVPDDPTNVAGSTGGPVTVRVVGR